MNLKIAVIGSEDTVDRILEVTKEFEGKAEFMPFKYKDKSQTIEYTKEIQKNSDAIIFSGEAPYTIALNAGVIKKPSVYVPRKGTSLYKVLWKMRDDNIDIKRISTEILSTEEVVETMEELEVDFEKIYNYDFDHSFKFEHKELADFHYNLWKDGKISAAVTGFTNIFYMLKDRGMPVYKLYPTKPLIREYINKAILLGKVKKVQQSQTAVQIVKIRNRGESFSSDYEFMMIKNKLESKLIKYTRDNFGSLFPLGRDEYLIFTNRGSIENIYNIFNFHSEIYIEEDSKIILSSGIGFGNTVYESEINARIALSHSIKRNYNCTFIMDESSNVSGPFSNEEDKRFTYDMSSGKNEEIRELAEKTSLSPVYISKLRGLIEKIDRNIVDANVVSSYLGISTRSARRILNVLVKSGFGKVKHTESKAKTGRPRKIYEINI
ncbi:hypothetical protein [Maledivibacter halophilus]|uniref:Transcriptional regulator n=1 Tax=Maledivibacter halophilus TaxID=36842 RepID=A0A1T5J311_9FIRM|nr:hypothetical protein [Maledivibacter halophilus]SKC45608.1 hypothetical protein SAMN02194393_00865 [Maledivibacter halophilus]